MFVVVVVGSEWWVSWLSEGGMEGMNPHAAVQVTAPAAGHRGPALTDDPAASHMGLRKLQPRRGPWGKHTQNNPENIILSMQISIS